MGSRDYPEGATEWLDVFDPTALQDQHPRRYRVVVGIDPAPEQRLAGGEGAYYGHEVWLWGGGALDGGGICCVDSYVLGCRNQNRQENILRFVVEWPGDQGPVRGAGKLLNATRKSAEYILQQLLSIDADIYCVPWAELARVVGYSARRDGPFDSFLNRTLKAWGYRTGRGTELNSQHLRSALLAALWLPWALHHHGQEYADQFKAVK